MATVFGVSDRELFELTGPFQRGSPNKDAAIELLASVALGCLIEPGDRAAGFLSLALGRQALLELLIGGFEARQVSSALTECGQLETFEETFGFAHSTLEDCRQRWIPRLNQNAVREVLELSARSSIEILLPEDSSWPQGVSDLGLSQPLLLFVEGCASLLSQLGEAVSIVGSRACSPYGLKVTEQLCLELAQSSRGTVSGGAVGIDAMAHQGSIRGNSFTVAVMAGGLAKKYPKQNFPLFEQVKSRGCLISELPIKAEPTRWRFLQRNRIIAALTPCTVVVEAGIRSGSIRTANNALELDRQLFAVPGPVTSQTSMGTNRLIADQKAQLLESPKALTAGSPDATTWSLGDLATRVQDALGSSPLTLGQICLTAGVTAEEAGQALKALQTANYARSVPGGWISA